MAFAFTPAAISRLAKVCRHSCSRSAQPRPCPMQQERGVARWTVRTEAQRSRRTRAPRHPYRCAACARQAQGRALPPAAPSFLRLAVDHALNVIPRALDTKLAPGQVNVRAAQCAEFATTQAGVQRRRPQCAVLS